MVSPSDNASSGARQSPSLALARWCAGNGWPVHPLAPGRKTPVANCPECQKYHPPRNCACTAAGRWCHGFHAATTDPVRLERWFSTRPELGVGVSCGAADLVIIDIDAHADRVPDRDRLLPGIPIHAEVDLTGLASGFDTLALLAALRGQPSPADDRDTLRVRTPSGGLHVWYRQDPRGPRFRSSTGSSSKVALAWQVDVRAENGYIVAPTTRIREGAYTPVGAARAPAPLPAWLSAELTRTGHAVPPPKPAAVIPKVQTHPHPWAATRLLNPLLSAVTDCAAVPEGASFTEKLNRVAYTAGGLVAAGHLTREAAIALLQEAAEQARPDQLRLNTRIISDALAAGNTSPLHLKGRP